VTRQLSPDPDLQALIRKLNAAAQDDTEQPDPGSEVPETGLESAARPRRSPRWPLPGPTAEGHEWLRHLLSRARARHASDLLLVVGAPPAARINGRLEPLGESPLESQGTGALCAALVPRRCREMLESSGAVDFSFDRKELGRFRCNVHRERDRWSAAVRLFPDAPPELESLNLPSALANFCDLEYGLVLVTGPTGCGKSTTLAAMARRILRRRRVHLITIEDPVEYEHAHGESLVEHIEIGRDVDAYARALRSALRQDPDVLLIGEMRDPESISVAITAAETGHLVFSTLHTGDGPQTIHRIVDAYPAAQQETVRVQLSVSLAGIVSQQLLPRADGKGRVPAVEILVGTPAVRNLIRQGKVEMIRSQLTLERGAGMLDLDRSLARLAADGMVTAEEAGSRARIPTEFQMLLRESGRTTH